MNVKINPGLLCGSVKVIPSKSQAHRLLICAAFADKDTTLECPQTNQDIEATASCLRSLGAEIKRTETGYYVKPIKQIPAKATLFCNESGSTLRFMLPIVAALGVEATFEMTGRLPDRPLSPLWEELVRMGCSLSRPCHHQILCSGKLRAGEYIIDGGVSSQFITGLLFAAVLIPGESRLTITGKLESAPYIDMTRQALALFGVSTANNTLHYAFPFQSPGHLTVEGDWSNAAFFLAAKALGSPITVTGLNQNSAQGDRAVEKILTALESSVLIDAADIPDLVPILAIVAGAKSGAVFHNIARLRLKESDRVAAVCAMLRSLGCRCESDEKTLTVHPAVYHGGVVDSFNDHRIAMAAAIAATVASGPVTVLNAQCTNKSYPEFWNEFRRLGGQYEQYIR